MDTAQTRQTSQSWQGDLKGIYIYDTCLSSSERKQVIKYIRKQYNPTLWDRFIKWLKGKIYGK
jgi:hypothetical protein